MIESPFRIRGAYYLSIRVNFGARNDDPCGTDSTRRRTTLARVLMSVGADRSDTASESPDIEALTEGAELQPSPFIYRCKGNDDETHDTIINE